MLPAKSIKQFENFWNNMRVKTDADGNKYLTQSMSKTIVDLDNQISRSGLEGAICVKSVIPMAVVFDTSNDWEEYEYPDGSGGSGVSGISNLQALSVEGIGKGKTSLFPNRKGRFRPQKRYVQSAVELFNLVDVDD